MKWGIIDAIELWKFCWLTLTGSMEVSHPKSESVERKQLSEMFDLQCKCANQLATEVLRVFLIFHREMTKHRGEDEKIKFMSG